MCFERIEAGLLPACVQGCVTGALQLVNLDDLVETGLTQYPAGYPAMKALDRSTRLFCPKCQLWWGWNHEL